MVPQLTENVQSALEAAFEEAKNLHQTEVTPIHLLKALFADAQGYFSTFAQAHHLNTQELIDKLELHIQKLPTYQGASQEPSLSKGLQAIFQEASSIAKKWNDTYIASDHLLLAFWKDGIEPFLTWKNSSRLSLQDIENELVAALNNPEGQAITWRFVHVEPPPPEGGGFLLQGFPNGTAPQALKPTFRRL